MSLAEFHDVIISKGWFDLAPITHNNLDKCLAAAHDFLLNFKLNKELRKEILSVFGIRKDLVEKCVENDDALCLTQDVEDGGLYIRIDCEENAMKLWRKIYSYFKEISPPGFSFGIDSDQEFWGWWPQK